MTYESYLIADPKVGLELDKPIFLLPKDAFQKLENIYLWRRRWKKKNGHGILGRLRRNFTGASLGNSLASPWTINLFSALSITEPQAQIVPGSVVITIAGPIVFTDQGDGTLTSPTPGNSGTINYGTSVVVLTHTAGVGVATTVNLGYYPGLPVMGLPTRELTASNAEQAIAFDTVYAYAYNNTTNSYNEFIAGTTWQGSNSDFFWAENYWSDASGTLFWVTNFNVGVARDPIRYADGAGATWTTFAPLVNGGSRLEQCKMLIGYRNRLISLYTYEGANLAAATKNPQRARWSQNGDPTDQVNGWLETTPGRGGFVDAPTSEAIISACLVKDLLIVRFERSVWKLRYTGNELLPFVWERINSEFGSDGRFTEVPFDVGPIAVGSRGIVQTDGVNALRIDNIIPDEVFSFHNENSGPERIHGIRDFDEQVVYWCFPNDDENGTFPNRTLLYNYRDTSWAVFRDSFTCFGYWQSFADLTWGTATMTWAEADFPWNSQKNQALYPQVIAGNQQGFVNKVQYKTTNDQTLRIENLTAASPTVVTSTNHNLETDAYIRIVNVIGNGSILNGFIYLVEVINANTFRLFQKPKFTITNITQATQAQVTAAGNSFNVGDLCQIQNVLGMTEINGVTARVVSSGSTFTIDLDTSLYTAYSSSGVAQNLMAPMEYVNLSAGTFGGFGEIERVDNFTVLTKKFNPYLEEDGSSRLGWIDFYFDSTEGGKFSVNLYVDGNQSDVMNPTTTENRESNAVETFPNAFEMKNQDTLWHSLFNECTGNFYQIEITLSEEQMNSNQISSSEVVLYALNLWYQRASERLT